MGWIAFSLFSFILIGAMAVALLGIIVTNRKKKKLVREDVLDQFND